MYCDIPDFGRCCFCMPLRRGVLVFGYINILFCAFMVGLYSYFVHRGESIPTMYHGVSTESLPGVCIAIYCVEIIFNGMLVYGSHLKSCLPIRLFYYYAITTTLAALLLQIVEFTRLEHFGQAIEVAVLTFIGLCIHLYLIALARSLLRKLEISDNNAFDNQLNLVVTGHRKDNGVYNSSTVPIDDA